MAARIGFVRVGDGTVVMKGSSMSQGRDVWHVYCLKYPLDYYIDFAMPESVWILGSSPWDAPGDRVRRMAEVKQVFSAAGGDLGDLRHDVHIVYDVLTEGHYFIFKHNNNGTTYLVSGHKLERTPECDEYVQVTITVPDAPEEAKRRRGNVSPRMQRFIARFNATCVYCKRRGSPSLGPDGRYWTKDHVRPVSFGGDNSPENLALACWSCNASKRDKPVELFVRKFDRSSPPGPYDYDEEIRF